METKFKKHSHGTTSSFVIKKLVSRHYPSTCQHGIKKGRKSAITKYITSKCEALYNLFFFLDDVIFFLDDDVDSIGEDILECLGPTPFEVFGLFPMIHGKKMLSIVGSEKNVKINDSAITLVSESCSFFHLENITVKGSSRIYACVPVFIYNVNFDCKILFCGKKLHAK